jgi:hypothetical protein
VDALALPAAFTALGAAHGPLIVIQQSGGTGSGTGSAGSNIGNPPTFAGYRDSTNTGYSAVYDTGLGRNVQLSDLAVYTGPLTFSSNTTLFRQNIVGRLTANAGVTVTINQSLTKGPDGSSSKSGNYHFNGPGTFVFIDTECDGNGLSGGDVAPYPSGYGYESANAVSNGPVLQWTRCNVHSYVDILKQANNSLVEYSWLHGNIHYYGAANSPTHSDHVQVATGSCQNLKLHSCTMGTPKAVALAAGTDTNGDAGPAWSQYETMVNAGFIQLGNFNAGKVLTGLEIIGCYANDGNYAFAGGTNANLATCSGLISQCRVGPHQRFGVVHGGFLGAAADGTTITTDGTNVIDDNFISYWGGSNNGTGGTAQTKGTVIF